MKELRDLLLDDADGSNAADLIARLQCWLKQPDSVRALGVATADQGLESWAKACLSAIHIIELFASRRSR